MESNSVNQPQVEIDLEKEWEEFDRWWVSEQGWPHEKPGEQGAAWEAWKELKKREARNKILPREWGASDGPSGRHEYGFLSQPAGENGWDMGIYEDEKIKFTNEKTNQTASFDLKKGKWEIK